MVGSEVPGLSRQATQAPSVSVKFGASTSPSWRAYRWSGTRELAAAVARSKIGYLVEGSANG